MVTTELNLNLDNLDRCFPAEFSEAQVALAKTLFL